MRLLIEAYCVNMTLCIVCVHCNGTDAVFSLNAGYLHTVCTAATWNGVSVNIIMTV